MYRNLFSRIFRIANISKVVDFDVLQKGLKISGENVDYIQLQCIIGNLIEKVYRILE